MTNWPPFLNKYEKPNRTALTFFKCLRNDCKVVYGSSVMLTNIGKIDFDTPASSSDFDRIFLLPLMHSYRRVSATGIDLVSVGTENPHPVGVFT